MEVMRKNRMSLTSYSLRALGSAISWNTKGVECCFLGTQSLDKIQHFQHGLMFFPSANLEGQLSKLNLSQYFPQSVHS